MFIIVTILHVIACLVLISVILLQSGRGGGLSEMLGGGAQQTQKIFGTQTSNFMTRATTYCAILFLVTSITLGLLTSRKSRSLMEGVDLEPFFDKTGQSATQELLLPEEPLQEAPKEVLTKESVEPSSNFQTKAKPE